MKGILLVSAIGLSALLVSCTDAPSTASLYKEKLASGEASGIAAPGSQTGNETPATVSPDTNETTVPSDDPNSAEDPSAETTGSGAEEGDPVAGATLLVTCKACHKPGGPGTAVTLNAAAVGRLDTATTGPAKGFHSSLTAAFVDGRADLEAALNAIK